jgi:tetratricopeptide (TPR) repeat protein
VGHLDNALGVYQLGVQLYPKDLNLLTELGLLLHRSKLEEQAEPMFQKVLKIHPNNAAAHIGLGEIDHALGFLERSAEHYEKALETMSDHAGIWADYAEVLISARDYKTGELAARRALLLSENADARVDLARALRGEGRLDERSSSCAPPPRAAPTSRPRARCGCSRRGASTRPSPRPTP